MRRAATSHNRYRGPDRRSVQPARLPRVLPVTGGVIALLMGVTATVPLTPQSTTEPWLFLSGAAAVGGLALAVAGAVSWRASGRAAPLWLSAGATAYILWQIDPVGLWDMAAPQGVTALRLGPAAAAVVWLALMGAALWPTVDSELRPWMMFVGGGTSVLVLALILPADPGVLLAGDGVVAEAWRALLRPLPGVTVPAVWLVPAAWLMPALAAAVQGHRRRDPVLGWAALVALALAGAEALRWATGAPEPTLAGGVGHAAAVLAAAGGLGTSVAGLTSGHRHQLGAATAAEQTAQERLRVADAARAELVHEIHNALSTVDAGVSTLHANHDQLSGDDRAALSEAVRATIDRLRLLLDDAEDGPLRPMCLADALEPMAQAGWARGQTVNLDIPADLWVLARERSLTQVVAILLDNADKHAPAATVRLSAVGQQQGVILRCDDDGPGVPVAEREHVFLPGRRGYGAKGQGQGFGLPLAARLVHEQGGTMWVESRRGGGASFAVWLARPETHTGQSPAWAVETAWAAPHGS